jgi:hypothetical protein
MSSAADTLRRAADKIRTLATVLDSPEFPGLPWQAVACSDPDRDECPCVVVQARPGHDGLGAPMFYVADAETPECAAFIATMGPGVGTALADWLESTAATVDAVTRKHADAALAEAHWLAPALAVARAVLGEPPAASTDVDARSTR